MSTGSFFQKSPTPDDIALGACNYGYWGAGLITPHAPLKEIWWTDRRIAEHVNRHYVISHIRGQDISLLDENITLDSLTDDTYMEWILYKGPRLFRILVEIDCADRIFSLVDDGWQDEDLPLSPERIDAQKNVAYSDIQKLKLSPEPDKELERRFYHTQFRFLHRQLREDSHIAYGPNERIPIEYEGTIPPARAIDLWCRVQIPPEWSERYVRRHYQFDDDDREAAEMEFLEDVRAAKRHKHEHICDIWASYTSETEHAGYTLSNFVGEHTLLTFMKQQMPLQYIKVAEQDRPGLLLEWMHCLADGVAYLHKCENYHGDIRPSNVLVDSNNRIAFSDIGHLKTFKRDKRVGDDESRVYHAPEQLVRAIASGSSVTERCDTIDLNPTPPSDTEKASRDATDATNTDIGPPCPVVPPVPNFSRLLVSSQETFTRKTELVLWETSWITSQAVTQSIAPRSHALGVNASPGTAVAFAHRASPPKTMLSTPPLSLTSSSALTPATSLPASVASEPATPQSPPLPYLGSQSPHIASPPASPRPLTFRPHDPLAPLASNPVSTKDATHDPSQAADVFSLGCVYLDMLTFLVLGKITTLDSFRRARIVRTPQAGVLSAAAAPRTRNDSMTPDLTRAGSSTDMVSTTPSIISSSSLGRNIFTRRHRWRSSEPPSSSPYHFASDPGRVATWADHLLLESAKRALPCRPVVVELLVLVRAMLAPGPAQRPGMSHVRAVVEEVVGREKADLCCRGREWDVPQSGEGVDKGRRRKEPGVPREVLERLWELKKGQQALEKGGLADDGRREQDHAHVREQEPRKKNGGLPMPMAENNARQTVEVAVSGARRSKVISVLGDDMDDGRRRHIGLFGHTFARIRKKPVIRLTPRMAVS